MSKKLSAGTIALLGLYSASARANVFDNYGQSAATMAIGNASTAGGDKAFAAYTNPALLAGGKESVASAQAMSTTFKLDKLPTAAGSQLPPDNSDQPDESQGAALGLNLALLDEVHFGLATYMPQGNLGRIKGVSPYQPTYLRYSEQQEKPAIYTALGVKLPYGFGIGAGAYYTIKAKGVLQIALSNTESEGRMDIVMEPVVMPYGGLSWEGSGLTLGATYREAQETNSKIESAFAFSTEDALLPFEANTSLVPFYDPATFRFGGAWDGNVVKVLASYEQAQWSRYKAPLVTLTGNDVAAVSAENRSTKAGLKDTTAYRLGAIVPFNVGEHIIEARFGMESHSSANKSGTKSSVIDPSRNALALGVGYRSKRFENGKRFGADLAVQHSVLGSVNVTTTKDAQIKQDAGSTIDTFMGGLSYEL